MMGSLSALFNQGGYTVLHEAAKFAKKESLMVVLESGADVNAQAKVSLLAVKNDQLQT